MRQRYFVSYDIADPKRYRRVYKLMRAFGRHFHYSVFLCDLTPMQVALLQNELREILHFEEDRISFGLTGTAEGRAVMDGVENLGRPCEFEEFAGEMDLPRVI